MIKPLFPQPLWLSGYVQRRKRQRLSVPTQHIRVQLQRETGLRIVLGLNVQAVKLVNVPQIHFLAIDLALVEIQQVNGARHALVAILLALHDIAIVQQPFQQSRYR